MKMNIYNQLIKSNLYIEWIVREFGTWPDNAKYEEKQKKISPRAGIASSGIPANGEINLSLAYQKE